MYTRDARERSKGWAAAARSRSSASTNHFQGIYARAQSTISNLRQSNLARARAGEDEETAIGLRERKHHRANHLEWHLELSMAAAAAAGGGWVGVYTRCILQLSRQTLLAVGRSSLAQLACTSALLSSSDPCIPSFGDAEGLPPQVSIIIDGSSRRLLEYKLTAASRNHRHDRCRRQGAG